jgi:hypothetical protein
VSELILPVSLPDLPRNTRVGQSVARVRRPGYVPPCVQDAFSWLPPAILALPRVVERVIRKAQVAGFEAASATDEQILMLDGIKKAHIGTALSQVCLPGPRVESDACTVLAFLVPRSRWRLPGVC